MELNHTIVPAYDKEAAASFFAKVFGLTYEGLSGHFAPVRVNDSLTMDFDDTRTEKIDSHHYAFKVTDREFDDILSRLQVDCILYGSGPFSRTDMRLNNMSGGRSLYFTDINGHSLEILTHG
jgi:catechol 2,3-dioxygenase-like lactoylglutathione lyase family enzyme